MKSGFDLITWKLSGFYKAANIFPGLGMSSLITHAFFLSLACCLISTSNEIERSLKTFGEASLLKLIIKGRNTINDEVNGWWMFSHNDSFVLFFEPCQMTRISLCRLRKTTNNGLR
ncbi:hypothetical protein BCR42DRAFT_387502 [Absidia repens]|uniref:Uncharacterized protein n=1 Tax=Absidia repens TaxID=90262 RepID=A0A1X2IZI7_9FUNG|nr:hypothetical protein BCR42DRAFT_387502 [Absidia repens]